MFPAIAYSNWLSTKCCSLCQSNNPYFGIARPETRVAESWTPYLTFFNALLGYLLAFALGTKHRNHDFSLSGLPDAPKSADQWLTNHSIGSLTS